MSQSQHKIVEFLGVFGTIARGVVIGLVGVFLVVAAITADPKKARGIDGALKQLQQMTAGPFLLALVAIGLVAFGLFGFAEARWRKLDLANG
jgi:type IV secretory pathway VirB2 component (pilin)